MRNKQVNSQVGITKKEERIDKDRNKIIWKSPVFSKSGVGYQRKQQDHGQKQNEMPQDPKNESLTDQYILHVLKVVMTGCNTT